MSETIPALSWDEFLAGFKWKQGEHLTLVGPTGQGKTELARLLLRRRKYVVIFATKRKDPLIDKMRKEGYEPLPRFEGVTEIAEKVILKPPRGKTIRDTERNQRTEFQHAMEVAFNQGSWTVVADEGFIIADVLKLDREMKMLLQQGRTLGVTMVTGVQRPVNVPLAVYSQATHLFFFRNTDERDLQRLGGLGGMSNRTIREATSGLRRHEVLYLNTRTGDMATTKAKVK